MNTWFYWLYVIFTHNSKTGFGIVKLHPDVGRLFAYVESSQPPPPEFGSVGGHTRNTHTYMQTYKFLNVAYYYILYLCREFVLNSFQRRMYWFKMSVMASLTSLPSRRTFFKIYVASPSKHIGYGRGFHVDLKCCSRYAKYYSVLDSFDLDLNLIRF